MFPTIDEYATNSNAYTVPLALRTKSDKYYGSLIPRADFEHWLTEAIGVIQALDRIKKSLFYGRAYAYRTAVGHADVYENCHALPDNWKGLTREQAIDLIHGALGITTEAGELLELVRDTIQNPAMFNEVAWREESFDTRWYSYSCILPTLGYTLATADYYGFCKLRARFADKFTEEAANVRDLKAEAVAFTGDQQANALTGDGYNAQQDGYGGEKTERKWIGQPSAIDLRPLELDFVAEHGFYTPKNVAGRAPITLAVGNVLTFAAPLFPGNPTLKARIVAILRPGQLWAEHGMQIDIEGVNVAVVPEHDTPHVSV